MKLVCALMISFLSLNAFASADAFFDQLAKVLKSKNYETVELNVNALPKAHSEALLKIASQEADTWGDTILEGDYQLDSRGSVKLVAVEQLLTAKGKLIAYRITFAHEAFDTSSCDIDWEKAADDEAEMTSQLVEKCTAGHISSAAFVSPDLKNHVRDEDSIEDFSD